MKPNHSIFILTIVLSSLMLISCKEEPSPYSGPLELLDRSDSNGVYEAYVGDTSVFRFFALNRKYINYTDIEFYRYRREDANPDKSWKQSIFFKSFYNIPSGDTLVFSFILPDTLSSASGQDESGFTGDWIHAQTRYKGGSDQSVTFVVKILERED